MSALSVVSVADRAGFHVFATALRASTYASQLEALGPFTVFAPSDAAFGALSKAALDQLLHEDNERLQIVLGYHIAAGRMTTQLLTDKRIRGAMQAGGDVIIDGRSGMKVNTARLVKPDLMARNGVVHGIDALLWPREKAAAAAS